MTTRSLRFLLLATTLFACAKAEVNPGGSVNGGASAGGAGGSVPGFGGTNYVPKKSACETTKCTDFPAAPIVDQGAPANAGDMFSGTPGSGAGPCIVEPEDGTLFPRNWLRPRIRWVGGGALTQIKVTSAREANELVVYTTKDTWTMPKDVWDGLAANVVDEDITVTVRTAGAGASSAKFRVAPVEASGSMVFWAAVPSEVGKDPAAAGVENDSELRGFKVGEETTVSALKIPQVEQPSKEQSGMARHVKCIGCHAATPDGQFVAFVDHWPWNLALAGVKNGIVGKQLPGMGAGGLAALNQPWGGMVTFSGQHWRTGDRIALLVSSLQNPMQPYSTDNKQPAKLVWYDLDAAEPPMMNGQKYPVLGMQFGVIARTGDPGTGAASPSWSHDGTTIVYASTTGGNMDGRLEKGKTDLYTVPYNNKLGGEAKPLIGASEAGFEEYYPAYSPDDKLIAFNRVPAGESMYANPHAELFVATASGGATRMRANDPPTCSGKASPGINNHWARWSPQVQSAGSATYYWVIFSSNRAGLPPVMSKYTNPAQPSGKLVEISQLYVTAVVVTESGVSTFPAIYLWNQPTATLNTTPIWESIELPPPG